MPREREPKQTALISQIALLTSANLTALASHGRLIWTPRSARRARKCHPKQTIVVLGATAALAGHVRGAGRERRGRIAATATAANASTAQTRRRGRGRRVGQLASARAVGVVDERRDVGHRGMHD